MMNQSPIDDETPNAKRRREQVLSAAADCFQKYGFHGTSMAQISATAKMSAGHIYHYFGGKEGIIKSIVEREYGELGDLLDQVEKTAAERTVNSAIAHHFISRFLKFSNPSSASLTIETVAEASRNTEIAELVQANDEGLMERFLELIGNSSKETRSRCEIVAALQDGLAMRAIRNPKFSSSLDQDMLQEVVHFILTGDTPSRRS
ncbi:TetR/AcrR family transcriptional regulator [Stenotrophomonas maltophilia]|uniref:TetR/AcrR family transcriptional regulator n=1 Tax=Stenotrophomonas maltophilia TaxID=40324 RepID=UPI003BF80151